MSARMTASVFLNQKPLENDLRFCQGLTLAEGQPAGNKRTRRTTIVIVVVLGLVVAGVAAVVDLYDLEGRPGPLSTPNPCGQVYEGQNRPEFVMCKGFVLTESGAACNLSAGSCTMNVIDNETSRYNVVATECSVVLPILINGSATTVTDVEAINGGPAASGVPKGSESGATCWFPTNRYMTNATVDQGVNGCFTFAQTGNLTNSVGLCWSFGKWNTTPSTNPPLDCPALLGNLGVSFPSVNASASYFAIRNNNYYGIWLAVVNGTATVGPLGIAVNGPYVGDWFAIPQNETVAAKSSVILGQAGTPNTGQEISFTLSFLPTNETITYTQPCLVTYRGTFPATTNGPV